MKSSPNPGQVESEKVISPFAQTETTIPERKRSGQKLLLIGTMGCLLFIGGIVVTVFAMRYFNNPYRTLQTFPVSKYLDNYQALSGSKYKADFRVENDLGWKERAGRLMLFSTAEDARPIAVLVPAAVANGIYFTKGQSYTAEIEVKEGGLIYADSFQKD